MKPTRANLKEEIEQMIPSFRNISIDGFDGEYKVVEYTLDRETGSVFDLWLENGAIPNPTNDELDILKKKTGPDGKMSMLKGIKSYNRNIIVKPHGVHLVEIQKIYQ